MLSGHGAGQLLVKAIEDELDPRGNSELVEDAKEVVANDLLRARGWPIAVIDLAMYGVTVTFAATGLYGMRTHSRFFWAVALLTMGGFMLAAIRLGSTRADNSGKLRYIREDCFAGERAQLVSSTHERLLR